MLPAPQLTMDPPSKAQAENLDNDGQIPNCSGRAKVQGLTTWGQKVKLGKVPLKGKQAQGERRVGSVPICYLINYPSHGVGHIKEERRADSVGTSITFPGKRRTQKSPPPLTSYEQVK